MVPAKAQAPTTGRGLDELRKRVIHLKFTLCNADRFGFGFAAMRVGLGWRDLLRRPSHRAAGNEVGQDADRAWTGP